MLCSDVLYDAKAYPALLATFQQLFKAHNCAVLFALKQRFPEYVSRPQCPIVCEQD